MRNVANVKRLSVIFVPDCILAVKQYVVVTVELISLHSIYVGKHCNIIVILSEKQN